MSDTASQSQPEPREALRERAKRILAEQVEGSMAVGGDRAKPEHLAWAQEVLAEWRFRHPDKGRFPTSVGIHEDGGIQICLATPARLGYAAYYEDRVDAEVTVTERESGEFLGVADVPGAAVVAYLEGAMAVGGGQFNTAAS